MSEANPFPQDPPRPAAVTDLVAYQEGSVVSRTVLKKPTGNVTLFAFDREQALTEHTSPFDALVHVLDGTAEISVDGRPFTVRAGEMVVLPANHPHALRAVEPFKMMLVMVRS